MWLQRVEGVDKGTRTRNSNAESEEGFWEGTVPRKELIPLKWAAVSCCSHSADPKRWLGGGDVLLCSFC